MATLPASTAKDLTQGEREYAEAISFLAKIDVLDAERRVRLWKTDKVLRGKMLEVAASLGPDVVVTNAQWTGPTMTDVEISAVPRPTMTTMGPAHDDQELTKFDRNGQPIATVMLKARSPGYTTGPGAPFLRSSTEPKALTPDEHARARMRARIAEYELRGSGMGRARTALSSGLVRL